jgi:hypothetical protein
MMPYTPHLEEVGTLARVTLASDTIHSAECEHPIFMVGSGLLIEADTGRILHRHDTSADEPVRVRCRNRRASVCRACSALYRLDAYHLITAGLRGGKNTPATVADRPRLFVTLTAPSFGKVHLGPEGDGTPRRCHTGRRKSANGCGRWHLKDDPLIGTPLDPDGYDYTGQVLFNAHAGLLWRRLTIEVRRALAKAAGLSRKDAHAQVRVVFAKVAEFQTRGCVHYHAVVRLDGPDGPGSAPPAWATAELLETAIRDAAGTVHLTSPATATVAARTMAWGRQLDIQYLPTADPDLSDVAIAKYVAKYATKAAEVSGVTIAPLFCLSCKGSGVHDNPEGQEVFCRACQGTGRRRGASFGDLSGHGRTLVEVCWQLGGVPAYAGLRLRRWAHQIGYRGHFTTKSRSYSTTFAALRGERAEYNIAQHALSLGIDPNAHKLIVVGDWRYAGDDTNTIHAADRGSGGRP